MKAVSDTSAPEIELSFDDNTKPFTHLALKSLETRYKVDQIPFARLVLGPLEGEREALLSIGDDAKRCREGVRIAARTRFGAVLFEGVITSQELRVRQQRVELVVKARHDLQRLASVRRSAVFLQKSDAAIIREIAGAHQLRVVKLEGLDSENEQVVQYDCSDWAFLKRRLSGYSVWLLPRAETFDVVLPKLEAVAHHVLHPDEAEINQHSFKEATWHYSNLLQPARLIRASWQIASQDLSSPRTAQVQTLGSAGLDPGKIETLAGADWVEISDQTLSPAEEARQGAADLMRLRLGALTLGLTTAGTTQYTLGQTLELRGFNDRFDGSGLISGVSQMIGPASWRTTVEIGGEADMLDDGSSDRRLDDLRIGVIAPVEQDPKDLGRVRVSLPGLGAAAQPLWARVTTFAAGKNGGFCFYPEPGDEVIVGFLAGQIDQPVIMGSMFNPKNPAPIAREAEGQRSGFVVGEGDDRQSLIFDTHAKTVTLETVKGSLTLGNEETRLVRVDGSQIAMTEALVIAGKSLDLKIEAKATVAAGTLDLKAGEQASLAGSSGVKIEGPSIDMTR